MKQLTIRGFEEDLSEAIRQLAKRDDTSLNKAALKLLRKGAGLTVSAGNPNAIGSSLDHFIGTMSPDEAAEMDAALEIFETIDEDIWK